MSQMKSFKNVNTVKAGDGNRVWKRKRVKQVSNFTSLNIHFQLTLNSFLTIWNEKIDIAQKNQDNNFSKIRKGIYVEKISSYS